MRVLETEQALKSSAHLEWGLVARYATDRPLPHERAVVRWAGEICTMTLSGETEWPVSVVGLMPIRPRLVSLITTHRPVRSADPQAY